jgi:hypothetical protein
LLKSICFAQISVDPISGPGTGIDPGVWVELEILPKQVGSPRELNLVRTLFPGCLTEAIVLEGKGMPHLYLNEREKNGV